jgi:ATP-dependent DNA helicase PIF1
MSLVSLTHDQERAVQAVSDATLSFISGPAGTGKSFLIHYLTEQYQAEGKTVHLLSSTGISAYHIKGMTVHSFLARIQMKESSFFLNLDKDDVIIVDEISMLGKKIFEQLDRTLRNVYYHQPERSNQPFGDQKIIFFGDFAQLPPVNDDFAFQSNCWSHITTHCELTEIKRQHEPEFVDWLLRVRSGKMSMKDRKMIADLPNGTHRPDAIHLFASNEEALEYNERCLQQLCEEQRKTLQTYSAEIQSSHFSPEETETFFQQRHQCYHSLTVCVGSKIMLTRNIDTERGWCNGTTGWIQRVTPTELVMAKRVGAAIETRVIAKHTYCRIKCGKECQAIVEGSVCGLSNCKEHPLEDQRCPYVVQHGPRAGKKCHAVDCKRHPRSEVCYLDVDEGKLMNAKQHMVVKQFPILLAWGITIHKSQGMTLEDCVIHLPKYRYQPSLVYVALSRCKTKAGISLYSDCPIKYDCICPDERVMREMFRYPMRTCGICSDVYVGPYVTCQDCSSAPGKYSMWCFKDFEKRPTDDMMRYVEFAIEHPGYSSATRWKKFVKFLQSVYKEE